MYIKEIHIKSFGALTNKVIKLDRSLNIIQGANESGKSTVAMFLKFVLYGLSGKASGSEEISEKEHYVNWENGLAAGYILAECRGGEYIIERRLYRTSEGGRDIYRESVKIVDRATGDAVKTAKSPGEYFFGFPEKVFVQSAFVKNIDSAKIDGGGLKVALENLMSSGDEEINTKRAIEKLDSARKMLRYKKGSGGRIGDLEADRDRLETLLKDSQSTTHRIVDLEGTLADVAAKRAARDAEASELSALCRAYEAVRIGAKVKSIEKGEEEVAAIEKELAALDPEINEELLAKINICESTVSETESDIDKLAEKRAELEAKREGRDEREPEDTAKVMADAGKYRKGSMFCLSAGCALAVFAFVGLLLIAVPSLRAALVGAGYFVPAIVVTALFLLLSVTGFVLFRRFSVGYDRFLDSWGAEDEESLESAVMAKQDSYKYTKKLSENISRIDSIMEEAITKHDREIDRGTAYGERLGVAMSDNVFEVLAEAKEKVIAVTEKRKVLTSRLESARGRLSAILEDVGEEERGAAAAAEREALEYADKEKLLSMTKDDYNRALRERDFAATASAALKDREASLEKELAALNAAGKTPSEIAGRMSVVENEIDVLTKKHAALVTALEALERAGEKMRGDVMPRVASGASEIMGRVTDGKYASLSSGESFELTVNAGGERRPVDFLSEGTKDASYLSIRAALVKVMYGDEMPVMIFDECFARLDEDRLALMLGILSSDGMPQSLVFTCRSEEASSVNANVIDL